MNNKILFLLVVVLLGVINFGNIKLASAEDLQAENILIRNGDEVIFDGSFDLPASGTISVTDDTGTAHDVDAQSVLGVLYALDQINNDFSIDDLQYFDSFGSFYLKCLNGVCDNWQYVVNGVTPYSGIDSTILSGGETVGLFFGSPHQVTLNETELAINETLVVNAQNYNYIDNTWGPLTNVSIGVTQPNPDDQWNPIVISTNAVDPDGKVEISFTEPGEYDLGIAEDYYFPSYHVVVKQASSHGSSSSNALNQEEIKKFDIDSAVNFLKLNQKADGSFGDSLYTDWTAIAIASVGEVAKDLQTKLTEFFKKNDVDSKIITDNERHAMALMSLNINPYSDTKINYINKIVESFDGTQFGDKNIIADDIFALIVLPNVGYTKDDEIIKKNVEYVIANQNDEGAWVSVDMTSAGIQALKSFTEIEKVEDAIKKAEIYLVSKQNEDGGFENSSATSWAVQAFFGNDDYNDNIQSAINYLAQKQEDDGGVELATQTIENRIWATAYALPAVTNKPWNEIMNKFDKQIYVAPISPNAKVQNLIVVKSAPTKVATKKVESVQTENENLNTNQSASAINAFPKKNALQKFWHWLGNMF